MKELTNEAVLRDIEQRIEERHQALKKHEKLSDAVKTALAQLEGLNDKSEDILSHFVEEFISSFQLWVKPDYNSKCDVPIRAVCLEWSGAVTDPYDTDAGAWGYVELTLPDELNEAFPSFGPGTFDYCGSVDLDPVFEGFVTAIEEDDNIWNDAYELMELYWLKAFWFLHKACDRAVKTPEFAAVKTKRPFYFLANEHDQTPYLFYVLTEE